MPGKLEYLKEGLKLLIGALSAEDSSLSLVDVEILRICNKDLSEVEFIAAIRRDVLPKAQISISTGFWGKKIVLRALIEKALAEWEAGNSDLVTFASRGIQEIDEYKKYVAVKDGCMDKLQASLNEAVSSRDAMQKERDAVISKGVGVEIFQNLLKDKEADIKARDEKIIALERRLAVLESTNKELTRNNDELMVRFGSKSTASSASASQSHGRPNTQQSSNIPQIPFPPMTASSKGSIGLPPMTASSKGNGLPSSSQEVATYLKKMVKDSKGSSETEQSFINNIMDFLQDTQTAVSVEDKDKARSLLAKLLLNGLTLKNPVPVKKITDAWVKDNELLAAIFNPLLSFNSRSISSADEGKGPDLVSRQLALQQFAILSNSKWTTLMGAGLFNNGDPDLKSLYNEARKVSADEAAKVQGRGATAMPIGRGRSGSDDSPIKPLSTSRLFQPVATGATVTQQPSSPSND